MRRSWTAIVGLGACLSVGARVQPVVDSTFNIGTGADGIVEQVLQQPDGKILICGNFTSFNGQNKGYIARLNNDGSVDSSFTAGPGYWTRHMALQPDGEIIIGGFFLKGEGGERNRNAGGR